MNSNKNRRILIIDDNRSIHSDFRKILSPAGATHAALDVAEEALFGGEAAKERQIPFEIDSAFQGQEGLEAVKKAREKSLPYAMAFVDIRMPPGWDGVETTQKIWEIDPEIQIVICTAYSDYSWEEMFEKIGNDDRMVILKKPFDTVEALQLAHALTEKWWLGRQSKQKIEDLEQMVSERTSGLRQANQELREATEQLNRMFTLSPDMIFTAGFDGYCKRLNPAFEQILGYSNEELLAEPFLNFAHPDDRAAVAEAIDHTRADGKLLGFESRYRCKDGSYKWIQSNAVAVSSEELFYIIGRDITERKKIEARLFQSQKMETIGKLAGGVAHEFNSIMTAIIGQSEMLLEDLSPGNPLRDNATEIRDAANRAAGLTRQLLAYGRKQILQPQALNLNEIIFGMENMFRHLMGGDVDVRILPAPDLKPVHADAGQIEQVIINMAMNARDAMANGGKLTLETANIAFDEDKVGRYPELKPGDYVLLAISDTGSGMNAEVKEKAFDPFFSTKGVGQGTGLGLATCYGIIKQSGGHINVYSEQNCGTTFKIYLPQMRQEAIPPPASLRSSDLPHGTETILLVEDDPALRKMAADLARRLGYTVLTAANGMEALALMEMPGGETIDLLFTDVVMPQMTGRELSERVLELHPTTKILFTSAYTENAITHQGVLDPGVALLQKPFSPSALARKMREVLDGPPNP